jgi:hypothetical protein
MLGGDDVEVREVIRAQEDLRRPLRFHQRIHTLTRISRVRNLIAI